MNGFVLFFAHILDYALVIQILAVSVSVVVVLSPVQKNVKSILFALLKIGCFFVAEVMICALLFMLATDWVFLRGNCFLIGYIFCILVYAIFFCKYQPKVRLIMASTVLAISVIVLEFAALLAKSMENAFAESVPIDWMGIVKSLMSLFALCFAFIQAKFSIGDYDSVPVSGVALTVVGSLLSATMCFAYEGFFASTMMSDNKHFVFMSMVFGCFYIIDIVSYMLIYFVCRERDAVIRLEAEKQMSEANAEMIRVSKKNLDYLRSLRHDIRNQYSYAEILLENGQYDEAKKFFRSIGNDVDVSLAYIDSGNKNIDAIINMEMSKADAYGVKTDVTVVVPPRLPLSDNALCSIISNLIDNAVEACVRFDLKEQGVAVRIYPRQDYLYIGVENTLPPDVDKEKLLSLNTMKPDSANHGYGTHIVKRLVAQYNGYVTYSVENDKFIAEAMINMMSDDVCNNPGGG